MKFWSLVMCVIILVLGLMPCLDASAAPKKLKAAIETAHQGANPVQDHCSPFCHCSCCNTPSLTAMRTNLFSIAVEVINSYPELSPSKTKTIDLVIWQPPKLIS
ncbi:MAG: hypothetical protein C0191_02965 [Mucilaginibacter sp.]|nr:MAG: hypothetical protein C0191_02965 [Mucilaginibacter sp.]